MHKEFVFFSFSRPWLYGSVSHHGWKVYLIYKLLFYIYIHRIEHSYDLNIMFRDVIALQWLKVIYMYIFVYYTKHICIQYIYRKAEILLHVPLWACTRISIIPWEETESKAVASHKKVAAGHPEGVRPGPAVSGPHHNYTQRSKYHLCVCYTGHWTHLLLPT